MEPLHITLAGTALAFAFLASIVSVIVWMLDVPEQTATTLRVAKAVRLTERANRILVPVQGTALSDRMVALGAQMARAREAEVDVCYLIEVPWSLPLSAQTPESERMAAETLDRARRIVDRFGVPVETHIAQVRDAGRAIVEEAERTCVDIILMGDLPGRGGETRFNATTTYVFGHAPCEVIIDRPATSGPQATVPSSARPREVVEVGR